MPEDRYIVVNGKVLGSDEAKINPINRGQMYGDGCFDTMRVFRGKFFGLDLHYNRLKEGLGYIGIELSFSSEEFRETVTELIEINSLSGKDTVVRTQCWRKGGRGFAAKDSDHDWMIQCSPLKEDRREIRLDFLNTPCIPDAALSRKYKWTNSLNYIIAARESLSRGYSDGIMLNLKGYISETTIANLFWVEGDQIFTPSDECDLYPGITRKLVKEIIDKSGYTLNEGCYRKEEIHNAEAFFCTNSLIGIQGISAIGYREFDAAHPLIEELKESYQKKIADESV